MPDYSQVVKKLLEKTLERKVDWKDTYDLNTFIAVVDDGYSFELALISTFMGRSIVLTMKDVEGSRVFDFQANEPTNETSQSNDVKWDLLKKFVGRG